VHRNENLSLARAAFPRSFCSNNSRVIVEKSMRKV